MKAHLYDPPTFLLPLIVMLILMATTGNTARATGTSEPVSVNPSMRGRPPYEQEHVQSKVPVVVSEALPTTVAGWNSSGQELVAVPSFVGHFSAEPTVGFEDMTGWSAKFLQGATGTVFQSQDQLLQGDWVAHLRYQAPQAGSGEVHLLPPAPIAVPDEATRVGIWVYPTEWWGWEPQTLPPSSLVLTFEDAAGQPRRLMMESFNWKEWFWVDRMIPSAWERPLQLTGIVVTNIRGDQLPRDLYLDALTFYEEPEGGYLVRDDRRPSWYPKSPFATVPATEANPVVEVDGDIVWIHTHGHERVSYRLDTRKGNFADLEVWLDGEKSLIPFYQGGPVAEVGGNLLNPLSRDVLRQCTVQAVAEDSVSLACDWSFQGHSWSYTMRLIPRGKSLVIEIESQSGGRAIAFGRVIHATQEYREADRLIEVPYWTVGSAQGNPKVLATNGLFVSAYADWYDSQASRLYAVRGTRVDEQGAAINGGLEYLPLTDGTFNPMFERIVLNVSSQFLEVLPVIPNPPSPNREALKHKVHATFSVPFAGMLTWTHALRELQLLRALGVSHLYVRTHEEAWRDGGESFTFRTVSAPAKGGNLALSRYVNAVRDQLGYDMALYTNYTDYAPVNANFTEQWVARSGNGELVRAWPRTYQINSTAALAFQSVLAPIIADEFGVNGSYTDVHTARAPWQNVDFNHRAPGAGMFKTVYQDYGSLLLRDRETYQGLVISEGGHHWLYAGLVDGNYGRLAMEDQASWTTRSSGAPLLLEFKLHRIHPLQGDVNVDYSDRNANDPLYYRQLAMTIAYGNRAQLWLPGQAIEQAKRYHLMQPLQERYVMERVSKIAYASSEDRLWSEDDLLSAEEAIPTGAYQANRAFVLYDTGLRIWVNAGDSPWRIRETLPTFSVGGDERHAAVQNRPREEWILPVGGWLAIQDDFIAFSSWEAGERLDLVIAPDYLYINPHGRTVTEAIWNELQLGIPLTVESSAAAVVIPVDSLLPQHRPNPIENSDHVLIAFENGTVRFTSELESQEFHVVANSRTAVPWPLKFAERN